VYGDVGLVVSDTTILGNSDDIRTFLRDTDHYPLFVKPVRGSQGRNAYALHGLVNGKLKLPSDQQLEMADFITRLRPARNDSILFQELLHTHRNIETICGRRLTSVRIIVIVTPAGPEILSAVWRVPTGSNITDNFDCGRNGNIIAGIDLATGHIQRIVRGIGWENIPIDRHPDTGIVFGNLCLPDWQTTCALCLNAATLFPDLCLQHWDIALTDRGPVILEINVEGGMRTHQIVQQRGIYDEHLKTCTALRR
jgi:glutathione synthase/RimK-type ligase-like ATP-grasp enzyme